MSEASYTPGPWSTAMSAEHEPMYGEIGHTFGVSIGPRVVMLTSSGMAGMPEDYQEQVANAHLIAAAPELLEALEGLWNVVEGAIQSGDWQVDGACDPDAELHRAERVIKKAKGES